MQIFHIADQAEWEAAQVSGYYTTSTRGRSLHDEGFLHAARGDQWAEVHRRYYADVREPLLLLVIETDRLTAPWQEDVVGDTTYPHIYGPLNVDAVVTTVPLREPEPTVEVAPDPQPEPPPAPASAGPRASFLSVFVREVMVRMVLATAVFLLALVAGLVGQELGGDAVALASLVAVLVLGFVGVRRYERTRDRTARD